jgi:hypothetical protein
LLMRWQTSRVSSDQFAAASHLSYWAPWTHAR